MLLPIALPIAVNTYVQPVTFLLLRLAQAGQKAVASPLAFARLVRVSLMHRRPLDRLLEPEQPVPINPPQLALL